MLHNGLLNLMNCSTCFGHYYAHHQESHLLVDTWCYTPEHYNFKNKVYYISALSSICITLHHLALSVSHRYHKTRLNRIINSDSSPCLFYLLICDYSMDFQGFIQNFAIKIHNIKGRCSFMPPGQAQVSHLCYIQGQGVLPQNWSFFL